MSILVLLLSVDAYSLAGREAGVSFFEGRTPKQVLLSNRSVADTEACMLISSVAATAVRNPAAPDEVIFFSTATTLSGRHLAIWKLSRTGEGSKLEIFDLRSALRTAKKCFHG